MGAGAPLGASLTGLELLLGRAQLWQETAARHVSLAPQLEGLSRLALRWRRLQLAAWRASIRASQARAAQGALLLPLQYHKLDVCCYHSVPSVCLGAC
jgi:midasin